MTVMSVLISRSPAAEVLSSPEIVNWIGTVSNPAEKAIESKPAAAFAATTASRKLQSALHVPSLVSVAFVTVNTASGVANNKLGSVLPFSKITSDGRLWILRRIGNTATGSPSVGNETASRTTSPVFDVKPSVRYEMLISLLSERIERRSTDL